MFLILAASTFAEPASLTVQLGEKVDIGRETPAWGRFNPAIAADPGGSDTVIIGTRLPHKASGSRSRILSTVQRSTNQRFHPQFLREDYCGWIDAVIWLNF